MANWYVLKSASGSNSGSDWTNAWNEMDQVNWSGISAGDTIWLAGGTYTTALTIGKSGTSGSRITVNRVRTTDAIPVAATGWNSSYDAQVFINPAAGQGIRWNSGTDQLGSYVTIDGRIDQGIKSTAVDSETGAGIYIDTGQAGVIVKYVECAGPAGSGGMTFVADCSALWINSNGRGNVTNPTFQYCRFHGTVNLAKIGRVVGITLEYNKWYDNNVVNSVAFHQNVITAFLNTGTCIFRYNEVWNWPVEGVMLWSASVSQSWEIYSNLWHDGSTSSSRMLESQDAEHTAVVYQNTIVNAGIGYRTANGGTYGPSSIARNNLFYNLSTSDTSGITDADYNFTDRVTVTGANSISSGNNPFINYAGSDYRIVATVSSQLPRSKGINLGGAYQTDLVGTVFSSPPSMGAYEYVFVAQGRLKRLGRHLKLKGIGL